MLKRVLLPLGMHPDAFKLFYRARLAMISVDPLFAQKYTALAVTHGFHGSPHIDKQNFGPFYGLALGDFEEGTGGIRVECSARVIGKSVVPSHYGAAVCIPHHPSLRCHSLTFSHSEY